jgi:hypothetical protein
MPTGTEEGRSAWGSNRESAGRVEPGPESSQSGQLCRSWLVGYGEYILQ